MHFSGSVDGFKPAAQSIGIQYGARSTVNGLSRLCDYEGVKEVRVVCHGKAGASACLRENWTPRDPRMHVLASLPQDTLPTRLRYPQLRIHKRNTEDVSQH